MTIPGGIKAVLFDLDGVLIDSMPHHVSAWQEVFAQFDITIPSIALRLAEGEKAKLTMQRLAKDHGLDWSDEFLDELVARKRKIYRQSAPQGMRQIAREAVEYCRNLGLKTAIVTGSVKTNLEWTLSEEERALFDFILSSEFYKRSKPHPEPYLMAAAHLHLEPSQCLVIENAPLGIRSARAAEMFCVAIETTLPSEELAEADRVISDLDQLKELFEYAEK